MTFTLTHGYAVSLALHGALFLTFVAALEKPTPSPSLLVVELQGPTGDTQSEAEIQRETRGAPGQQSSAPQQQKQAQAEQQRAAEQPPPVNEPAADQAPGSAAETEREVSREDARPAPKATHPPSPLAAPPASGSPGRADVKGVDDPTQGQTLADAERDADRIRAYSAMLSKKVRRNLAYPDAGRKEGWHGVARVAFAIEADGRIHPGSLRIAESSGRLELDASALRTVRDSEPFDPPPHPITIVLGVDYGRRK